MILIIIGVCGCGKTTVGEAVAKKLGVPFRDADEFHSLENKKKMSQGIPLTDEDRYPWLMAIHDYIKELTIGGLSGVVTCSALKKVYRQILLYGSEVEQNTDFADNLATFVLLNGSKDTILKRMEKRHGHFMPTSLLESQLATLEIPDSTERYINIEIENNIESIVSEIMHKIS